MKKLKGFIAGLLLGFLIAIGLPAMGVGMNAKIDVVMDAVRVQVNGKDTKVSSILYNGKTYLGMREVAELVGKEVYWNQEAFTANIAEKGSAYTELQNKSEFVAVEIKNGIPYTAKIDGVEYYANEKLMDIFIEHDSNYGLQAPMAGFIDGFDLYIVESKDDWKSKTVIDNIPYTIKDHRIYIAKDYIEKNILPLLK